MQGVFSDAKKNNPRMDWNSHLGHVLVNAMGQSRPSLCQCCTATTGHFWPFNAFATLCCSGDEVLLRTRCQEPWSRTEVPDWMKALAPAFDSSEALLMLSAWEQFREESHRPPDIFLSRNGPGSQAENQTLRGDCSCWLSLPCGEWTRTTLWLLQLWSPRLNIRWQAHASQQKQHWIFTWRHWQLLIATWLTHFLRLTWAFPGDQGRKQHRARLTFDHRISQVWSNST